MFNILIDTSVWLDLDENQRQTPLIDILQTLVTYASYERDGGSA